MKIRILTTVSALALLAVSLPATAQADAGAEARWQEQSRTEGQPHIYDYTGTMESRQAGQPPYAGNVAPQASGQIAVQRQDRNIFERGWDRMTGAADDSWDGMTQAFDGRETVIQETLQLSTRNTAAGMIGKQIYTPQGEEIATVQDLIIDRDGNARTFVLQGGGFLGMGGQTMTMDYERLVEAAPEDKLIQSMDAQTMRNTATPFERGQAMSADSLSVSRLLGGSLINSRGEKVGEIENVTFDQGRVDYVVVSFDRFLGIGGQEAALKYADLNPVRDANGQVNLRMTEGQTQDFESYMNRGVRPDQDRFNR